MSKTLLFWPQVEKYKNYKPHENHNLSYKKDKYTTVVDWEKYHAIYSKKWLLDDLLLNIEYETINELKGISNKSIIIIVHDLGSLIKELDTLCEKNKIYLIHIGDEFFKNINNSIKIYKKCKFVFRPYYFFSNLKNIMHIPVGYKSSKSFYNEEKKYHWSFLGSVYKSSRNDMCEVFKRNFDNHYLRKTDHFNDNKSLHADEMYKIVSSSIYSLCPQGFNHPETYRLWEILENKSIPIVQDSLSIYDKILPGNNLIKINYWSEFLKIEKKIELDKTLNETLGWYNSYKKNLKEKIYNIINE